MGPEIFIFLAMMAAPHAMAGGHGGARTAPAAKVWMNADVEALRTTAPISIIGTVPASALPSAPVSGPTQTTSGPSPAEEEAMWFADQIEGRREEIDEAQDVIDTIEQIRATGEGISNVIPLDRTDPGITPEATIEILQDQQDELDAEIDGLQDAAREDFVPREYWR